MILLASYVNNARFFYASETFHEQIFLFISIQHFENVWDGITWGKEIMLRWHEMPSD